MHGSSRRSSTRNTTSRPAPCDAHNSNATHVTKPPRSNRQNLARLEIAVTHTEQRPEPNSNRQFLRPSEPLPWIQLQHEGLQLIQRGIFLSRGSLRGMTSRTMIMLLARV
jgi:hypothetical protein